jgi:hypothetical protein
MSRIRLAGLSTVVAGAGGRASWHSPIECANPNLALGTAECQRGVPVCGMTESADRPVVDQALALPIDRQRRRVNHVHQHYDTDVALDQAGELAGISSRSEAWMRTTCSRGTANIPNNRVVTAHRQPVRSAFLTSTGRVPPPGAAPVRTSTSA